MSRLNPATLIVVVFALLLALAGAAFVRQMLEQEPPAEVAAPKTYSVPVASIDLLPGRTIVNGDMIVMQLSESQYQNARKDWLPREYMTNSTQLMGRVLQAPKKKGQAFELTDLSPEGSVPGVSRELAAGQRAVTITIEGTGFVDGFASPGSLVDVLFRSTPDDQKEIPEATVTVMHGIEVLAVNRNPYPQSVPSAQGTRPLNEVQVTLAVSPVAGNVLKALEGRGEISLALRPEEEKTPLELQSLVTEQSAELLKLTRERYALANLKQLSETGDVEFTHTDRLTELQKQVPELTASLEVLQAELAAIEAANADANRQTLAQILNLEHEHVTVAVATAYLQADRMLRSGDFRIMELTPDEARVQGYLALGDTRPEELVGRTLKADVKSGSALSAGLLYADGIGPGVGDRLPNGFRAVTISLDRESFVDGYAAPGTTVDIFFRADVAEGIPDTTLMVLEGLDVLAVNGSVYPYPDRTSASDVAKDVKVTLAVPVESVGKLKAVEGRGQLTLALRYQSDRSQLLIERDLQAAVVELERARLEAEALGHLKKLAGETGLAEAQQKRLNELQVLLPTLGDKVAMLQTESADAHREIPQLTLADVLGVQAPDLPPPPRTVELYSGGQRTTYEFPQSTSLFSNATSRTRVEPQEAPGPVQEKTPEPVKTEKVEPAPQPDESKPTGPAAFRAVEKRATTAVSAPVQQSPRHVVTQKALPQQTVIHVVQAPVKQESVFPNELAEMMLKMNERLSGMAESLEGRLATSVTDQARTLKAAETVLAEVKKTRMDAARQVARIPEAPPMPDSGGTSRAGSDSSYVLHLGGANTQTGKVSDPAESSGPSRKNWSSLSAEPRQVTGSIELFVGGVRN